jgi:hypothetical protein
MATGGNKPKSTSASKPAATKIPAVIAKPSAPAPATKSSGAAPKGGGKAATGSKLVQPTKKEPIKTGGGTSSLDKQFAEGMKQIQKDKEELKKLLEQYNKNLNVEEDGGTKEEEGGGGEDPSLAYAKMQDEKARRNAFALLKDVFTQYGLSDLASTIETLMKEGYEAEEATLALKTDPRYNKAYITRFRGNELRRSSGLNVLSEAEYLALEDDYTRTLKSYGLENYFGVDKTVKQSAIADVIGADISSLEFTERVSTAVDRVKMADPATKSAFQQFYGIGEADLVQYFLDPKKALVNLKEKAVSAEIGGAAIGQGLAATATSATDLARYGISREQAQVGYRTIAEELPTADKLSQIYSQEGITYGQTEAEQATFKGLASAKRKKQQLVSREEAAFQGSSGTALSSGALSTQYLRRTSSGGQF